MGYTTEFRGQFDINIPLKEEHKNYLELFASTRRMHRDATKADMLPDPVRKAAGLDIGHDGGYFVGAGGHAGQNNDDSIIDYNESPGRTVISSGDFMKDYQLKENLPIEIAQPGLWCHWTPNEDGTVIEWDGGEKFYRYTEWIKYLIHHFLQPWGYILNGEVEWRGEDWDDTGSIMIEDNIVTEVH